MAGTDRLPQAFVWLDDQRCHWARGATTQPTLSGPELRTEGRIAGGARLIDLLKNECPNAYINAVERPNCIGWEFHEDQREVKGPCVTSDCFVLRPDGKISHCPLAIGGEKALSQSYRRLITMAACQNLEGSSTYSSISNSGSHSLRRNGKGQTASP